MKGNNRLTKSEDENETNKSAPAITPTNMDDNLLFGWNAPIYAIILNKSQYVYYLNNVTYYYQRVYNAVKELMNVLNAFQKFEPVDENIAHVNLEYNNIPFADCLIISISYKMWTIWTNS